MKFTVLNGSPKGMTSVTMQYVRYLMREFPGHEFIIRDISHGIKKIERDRGTFDSIMNDVKSSDCVIWATPVYFMLVPSQYKRFIELIWERNAIRHFKGRHSAVLITSIHFFDNTALTYLNAISDDLGMKYAGSFSADMYDLMKKNQRKKLSIYFDGVVRQIEGGTAFSRAFAPVRKGSFRYRPGRPKAAISTGNKKITVVTDCTDRRSGLGGMIDAFCGCFRGGVEVINLYDIDISGGCLGCCSCGPDNECIYGDSDGYINFYNSKIKTSDAIVFAGGIKDRYLSWKFKQYFDRSFFNTHAPSIGDKQVAFLISGPLSSVPNLRQILEGYIEMQHANLVDFVSDEADNSGELDSMIRSLAERLAMNLETGYIKNKSFLGVGGTKVFRDDVWGRLRFVFRVDHMYYKRHGIYDFPHRQYRTRLLNASMSALMLIPGFKKAFPRKIKKGMIRPFQFLFKDNNR